MLFYTSHNLISNLFNIIRCLIKNIIYFFIRKRGTTIWRDILSIMASLRCIIFVQILQVLHLYHSIFQLERWSEAFFKFHSDFSFIPNPIYYKCDEHVYQLQFLNFYFTQHEDISSIFWLLLQDTLSIIHECLRFHFIGLNC